MKGGTFEVPKVRVSMGVQGKKAKGAVDMTILGGEIVVENDEVIARAKGQHLGINKNEL